MMLSMARPRGHPLRSPEPLLRNTWQAQGQKQGQESYPTRSTTVLDKEQWESCCSTPDKQLREHMRVTIVNSGALSQRKTEGDVQRQVAMQVGVCAL